MPRWLLHWEHCCSPSGPPGRRTTATIEYAENGDGVVATFTAEDPEGVTPIYWSLANATQVAAEADLADADNADAADFMIDDEDGTLKFNIAEANDGALPGSPDFENGQGSGTGNNTYKVVVVACDVELAGDPAAPAPILARRVSTRLRSWSRMWRRQVR